MAKVLGKTIVGQEEIQRRTAELGRQISQDYSGSSVTLVGILKGSFVFLADIIRHIIPEIPVEVDFMSVSSYGNGTMSSGTIVIEKDIEVKIDGRDIIIVEDIV